MNRDGPIKTTPYQFEVPVELHTRVTTKMKKAGLNIAPFMRQMFRELDNMTPFEALTRLDKLDRLNTKKEKRK